MTAPPQPGEVLATIRALLPSLQPAERAVATTILQRSADAVEWSSQQVAEAAGASRATVVRTCQSLGFTGYQQFRVLLARDTGYRAHGLAFGTHYPGTNDGADGEANPSGAASDERPIAIVRAAFRHVAMSMVGMPALLDEDAVTRAVDTLAEARRVVVVGNGLSAPLAMDAAARMTGIGRPCEAPADVIYQQISARLLSDRDALLVISVSGSNVLSLRAAEDAQKAGATVIAITAFDRTHLTNVADIDLIVTMPDLSFQDEILLTTRLPQAILIEALVAALARRLGDVAGAAKLLAIDAVSDNLID